MLLKRAQVIVISYISNLYYFMIRICSCLLLLVLVSVQSANCQSKFAGFIENKGQIRSTGNQGEYNSIVASAQSNGLTVFFHNDFVSYQLSETDEALAQTRLHRVDLRLVEAQLSELRLEDESAHKVFYYTENQPKGVEVRSFAGLRYKNVYPGVDWVWTFAAGKLKHEFHVKAGSSHQQIKLAIEGANAQQINGFGQLELNTALGLILENAPQSFINGKPVPSSFQLLKNHLSYVVDRSLNEPLVIDPSVEWSTYYGGNNGEIGTAIDHDQENNLYITGSTSSTSLFADVPGFSIYGMGANDAFLLKFTSAGQLSWAAYFGGTGNDIGYALSVSPSGNYIAFGGYTAGSTNLASGMHPNPPHQATIGGAQPDGFIAVFSPAGQRIWSTYYGGNGSDYVYGMRWKSDSSLFVVGEASSPAAIATTGSFQDSLAGSGDGFIVNFNQYGQRLWATYYGGSERDYFGDIDFFSNGDLAVAGSSSSSTGLTTGGVFQPIYGGGNRDYLLVRFSPTGQRLWGTYCGGLGTEDLNHMRVDIRDQVYLYGTTSTTSGMGFNGFQMSYGGSGLDAYIGRFSPTGQRLWSSYFGGNDFENGRGMTLDQHGNAYFTGIFGSSNLPTTPNALQPSFGGGSYDSPVLKLDSSGNILWLTYFGGTGNDMAHAAVIAGGHLYITGSATSNYPLLEPYQGFMRGTSDVMLTSFEVCDLVVQLSRSSNGILCSNDTLHLSASPGFNTYLWNTGDTTRQIQVTNSGNFWVVATDFNAECIITSDTARVIFAAPFEIDTLFGDPSPLVGDIKTYAVAQRIGSSYLWSVQGGVVVSGLNTSIIQVAWTTDGPGSVQLSETDSVGCSDSVHLNVLVRTGVSVAEQIFHQLKVYPNPSSGDFQFSWEGDSVFELKLSDVRGKLIYEDRLFRNGSTLSLGDKPVGIYIYQLTAKDKQTKIGRLLLQTK